MLLVAMQMCCGKKSSKHSKKTQTRVNLFYAGHRSIDCLFAFNIFHKIELNKYSANATLYRLEDPYTEFDT